MKNIFKIIQISKPLHKLFSIASILILGSAVIGQISPIIIKFIVDEIEQQFTLGTGSLTRLYWLVGLFLAVNVVRVLLESVTQRLGDFIASRLGKYLTEEFYRKIFTLPQKYFDSEISGKIVNQLTRGILTIQDFASASTNFILPALLQSFFTLFVLAYFNITISLLAFAIFPIYIGISHHSTRLWGKREVEKNQREDVARGRIQEVISNIRLVKIFNTQYPEWHFVSKKYGQINQIYDRQSTMYHILNFIRNFGLEIVIFVIMGITFAQTFAGQLSLGDMVLVLQLLNQLRRPLFAMSFILERIQRAEAGSREYFQIMDLESVELFKTKLQKLTRIKQPTIEFKDVSFRYEEGSSVLKNINFKLDRTETIALVGHSGAGKSTIINLISKFYEPTAGEIFIDGRSYQNLDHSKIRTNISMVFQDNELFSSTIRENVAYGVEASDKQVIKALKMANAYDFVKKLPKGLKAEIGERGVKLSGGQKQRIQIARAILHDTPILILDEATSSLDSKSEKLVQDALEQLFKDRLVIIIAHRFSTIQNADRIIVIDDGKIVDSGTPKQLAQHQGIYSELLRYQVEGNKKLLSQYEIY